MRRAQIEDQLDPDVVLEASQYADNYEVVVVRKTIDGAVHIHSTHDLEDTFNSLSTAAHYMGSHLG